MNECAVDKLGQRVDMGCRRELSKREIIAVSAA